MRTSFCVACFAACLLTGGCSSTNAQKFQVLMPQPQSHASGSSVLLIGAAELSAIVQAAKAAGTETQNIVDAQLMSRLPPLNNVAPGHSNSGVSQLTVEFLHKLSPWKGATSWQPIRQRNESYGLWVRNSTILVDAQSSWALANAMSTLYQLLEVRMPTTWNNKVVSIPGCPHEILDRPAYPYRGLLLDTARTFYPITFMKDLIVELSVFKLNVLHLHLTDTAAWPLEVTGHPELTKILSYKDNNREDLTYSRTELRDLVEFARLRGISVVPEVDGPAHAPALAGVEPLRLTVAASADFSTEDFSVEPPPGTWNYSDARVTSLLSDVFRQLETDFTTAPYLHVGGDEPKASSLCVALTDDSLRAQCLKECTARFGGSPYAPNCAVVTTKPENSNQTFWFPEVLNPKIQKYFDEIVPEELKVPVGAWSGVRTDMDVNLPKLGRAESKPMLQLWEFPASSASPGITSADCKQYDLVQSSATHPQGKDGSTDAGWMYLECGAGQNWISMAQNYWCSRASWVSMYAQNLTQQHASTTAAADCQSAFVGAEIAIWGEITSVTSAMSLIFPRAAAFAERAWTNPTALTWQDLTPAGMPPAWYWEDHLKGALARLNTVVENLDMRGVGVSRLQPKFCSDHPEYCTNYTHEIFSPPKKQKVTSATTLI